MGKACMSHPHDLILYRFENGGSIAVTGTTVTLSIPSALGFDHLALEGDALDALLLASQRARANRPALKCHQRGGVVTRQQRVRLWVG